MLNVFNRGREPLKLTRGVRQLRLKPRHYSRESYPLDIYACVRYTVYMLIKKTVYIREEDLELWKNCPNKSLMVHNALNINFIDSPTTAEQIQDIVEAQERPVKTSTKFAPHNIVTNMATGEKFLSCKHGYNPKFCKHAKGGKPCK